jgi:hypothetical protein
MEGASPNGKLANSRESMTRRPKGRNYMPVVGGS